jgi:hypothetical protein
MRSIAAGDIHQSRAINYFKYTVFPANCLAEKQSLERLVCMNQRHAQRIG